MIFKDAINKVKGKSEKNDGLLLFRLSQIERNVENAMFIRPENETLANILRSEINLVTAAYKNDNPKFETHDMTGIKNGQQREAWESFIKKELPKFKNKAELLGNKNSNDNTSEFYRLILNKYTAAEQSLKDLLIYSDNFDGKIPYLVTILPEFEMFGAQLNNMLRFFSEKSESFLSAPDKFIDSYKNSLALSDLNVDNLKKQAEILEKSKKEKHGSAKCQQNLKNIQNKFVPLPQKFAFEKSVLR